MQGGAESERERGGDGVADRVFNVPYPIYIYSTQYTHVNASFSIFFLFTRAFSTAIFVKPRVARSRAGLVTLWET